MIKITIQIDANEKADAYYRNNYMLEITGSYDMSEFLSVESEEAMVTDTGNARTMMFIVLPGQSTTVHLELGSNDFSMDGITMALVPITGDIRDQIVELVEDKKEVEDAIDSMNKSADVVLNSMAGMTAGINSVSNGVKEMQKGTQNLHGLGELRDTDVERLKEILKELLPVIEASKTDIENMQQNYTIAVAMSQALQEETQELAKKIQTLNNCLTELKKSMESFPKEVAQIDEVIEATEDLLIDCQKLLKGLSGSSSTSTQSLTQDLTAIATETATIGTLVQQTVPTVTEPEVAGALLSIGSSASEIGTHLQSVQTTLNSMSKGTLNGSNRVAKDLDDLAEELEDIQGMISKKEAQQVVDTLSAFTSTSQSLQSMLETVVHYQEELLQHQDDFYLATENMTQLVNELTQMDTLAMQMIENAQNMLSILSSDIYSGTQNTANALISLNGQLAKVTSQSHQIQQSKDDVKKIVDDKLDEIEEKTNLMNLEKDAKVVSFGAEENENVESVQFVIKTPDIKKASSAQLDLEQSKETLTFWEKVAQIFQKIWQWITGIFS